MNLNRIKVAKGITYSGEAIPSLALLHHDILKKEHEKVKHQFPNIAYNREMKIQFIQI
jgi:hypothetical protein